MEKVAKTTKVKAPVVEETPKKKMADHTKAKVVKENPEKAAKVKESPVKPEKLSKAQQKELMVTKMGEIAAEEPAKSRLTLQDYMSFFQVKEAKDFSDLIMEVNEEDKTIILKNGFVLPIYMEEDSVLSGFFGITNAMLSPDAPHFKNLVEFQNDNEDIDENVIKFFYALMEFIALGRKAPNIDWNEVEDDEFAFPSLSLYDIYLVTQELSGITDPASEEAIRFKSMMKELDAGAWDAVNSIFTREGFKKLGISYSTFTDGQDVLFDSTTASQITQVMFDLYGSVVPVEEEEEIEDEEYIMDDEDEDEEEGYEEPAPKKKVTKK